MDTYVILLRGINVGGKNTVSMAELKKFLEELGCETVRTLLNSGNVIVRSKLGAETLTEKIEEGLPRKFDLDSPSLRVLVLSKKQFTKVVADRPHGFGDEPKKYHSDAIFLMGINADEAMKVFQPREGIDKVWTGSLAIYSQRLSAERTKSRLSKIVGTPAYASMTIRSWNTTMKLFKILEEL